MGCYKFICRNDVYDVTNNTISFCFRSVVINTAETISKNEHWIYNRKINYFLGITIVYGFEDETKLTL